MSKNISAAQLMGMLDRYLNRNASAIEIAFIEEWYNAIKLDDEGPLSNISELQDKMWKAICPAPDNAQ